MTVENSREVLGYKYLRICPNRDVGTYACRSALGQHVCAHLAECLAMREGARLAEDDQMKRHREWHKADLAEGIVHIERNA